MDGVDRLACPETDCHYVQWDNLCRWLPVWLCTTILSCWLVTDNGLPDDFLSSLAILSAMRFLNRPYAVSLRKNWDSWLVQCSLSATTYSNGKTNSASPMW